MIKYFILAILLAFPASARELHDYTIHVELPTPATITPQRAFLPDCNEPQMLEMVTDKIKEHQSSRATGSIIERRAQALMVKNLNNFTELSVEDFDNASNYTVANELVMTKINLRIRAEHMRLCKGSGRSNIYLLIYPEGEGFRVQILNFVPPTEKGNNFSILYIEN